MILSSSFAGPEADSPSVPGRILTFYSYKGGTGRSMTMANVAWMLALNNKRVLVIDWDLEAPGLHRYFHPFLADKELQSSRGLIDFVEDLAARSAASPEPLPDEEGDISSYVMSIDREGWDWDVFGPRAGIDLLPAGQQSAGYSTKVNSFNWIAFYQSLGGRRFLRYMASQLREIYDYVLIDSRTGVSDTSGICTVEMPDAVVVCFTLNEQSIRGAANVCESMLAQRSIREQPDSMDSSSASFTVAPFQIYPVPTRVETQSEYTKRQIALALVHKTFSKYVGGGSLIESRRYFGSMQMPYVPFYAFEEIPAVFGDAPDDQLSICALIGRLTRTLANEESVSLQMLPEEMRLEVLDWYQRANEVAQDPAELAESAFDQFRPELQRQSIQVLLRLVQLTAKGPAPQMLDRDDLQDGLSNATDALVKARIVKVVASQDGHSLQLSDPVILQNWKSYQEWVSRDIAFLQWRQSISTAARSWNLSGRQRHSYLLRDDSLDEAKIYQQSRSRDLNEEEQAYILASIKMDDEQRKREEINRTDQEALRAQLDELTTQLAGKKEVPKKPRWYISPGLFFLMVSILAIGALAIFMFFRWRELKARQNQDAALAERYKQLEDATDRYKQLEAAAAARAASSSSPQGSGTTNKAKSQTPNSANSDAARSPVSNSSTTAASSNPQHVVGKPGGFSFSCHIIPTYTPWTEGLTPLAISLDGEFVDGIDVGSKGSKGLNFACSEGRHKVSMKMGGTSAPPCDVFINVKNKDVYFHPYYNLQNGNATCRLEPVSGETSR